MRPAAQQAVYLIARLSALIVVVLPIAAVLSLVWQTIAPHAVVQEAGLPASWGRLALSTLFLASVGSLLGGCVGAGAAIYCYGSSGGALPRRVRALAGVLVAVPGVSFGLLGAAWVQAWAPPSVKTAMLVGACVLSAAITARMYAFVAHSLKNVPAALRRTAMALGASEVQTSFGVMFAYVRPHMYAGLISNFAWALGAATALQIVFGRSRPAGLFEPQTIATNLLESGARGSLTAGLAAAALALTALTLALVFLARRVATGPLRRS